jgi:hypothetical protein
MKYSILTASNSNNIEYYKKYVNSINNQIILPTELIFVNNKTNLTNLRDFLFRNLNKKIKLKYLNSYFTKNVSYSLNLGLKHASNLIIFRLDIDDQWLNFHSKFMIKEYKKNKKYLIYSNDYKLQNLDGFSDANLITDNPTVHSSWLLNLNICRKFNYKKLFPEDYGTLSYYFRKGYKFKLLNKKTIIYNRNLSGLGSKKFSNLDLKIIKKRNLSFYFIDKNYFNLIKELGFFGMLKFIFR